MSISNRVQSIDSSGIRKVFDLAAKLEKPVNLSIGQPDFDAFPELKQKAVAAIEEGKNSYTPTQGIEPLRQDIRDKYGIDSSGDADVAVTSGVAGGLWLSYMALLDPGDEIVVPDPFFCVYRDVATLLNAKAVTYNCYPSFAPAVEKIEKGINSKTKAIVVNSPANPTGYALSQSELDEIIDLAAKHELWIIYDEIYEEFSYDQPHAACFGKYEKSIVLNGYSKSYGVTGWRLGTAIAPKEIIAQMLKVQQYSFVCAPSICQWAVVGASKMDLSEIRDRYREKRDLICSLLKDKFEFTTPGGAFYLFPKVPTGESGTEFVTRCIENNLLVVPGNVFSTLDTHFRISFAAANEQLEAGAEILNSLA